jgi:protease-4
MDISISGMEQETVLQIRKPSWIRTIMFCFAGIGIIVCLLIAAVLLLGSASYGISEWYTGDNGVEIIRVEGTIITGQVDVPLIAVGSEVVGKALRNAADNPHVNAIVLRVNSPGETPAGAQEIVRDLDYARSKKPVVVSMGDMATSAAYYISTHASRIYANPGTLTASVGTIVQIPDNTKWMEQEGHSMNVIKSGAKKDLGSEYRSMTSDERAYIQGLIDKNFEVFISDVMAHRPGVDRSAIADGRMVLGSDAVGMHIVDEIGNLNDVVEGAKKLASSSASVDMTQTPASTGTVTSTPTPAATSAGDNRIKILDEKILSAPAS